MKAISQKILEMRKEMLEELENDILPFWMHRMIDNENGGFIGRISGAGEADVSAPKGAILNARILWAFSSAYRVLGKAEYLETATRAKREIIDRFYDKEYGGVFWSLDSEGRPLDTRKQIYALGFAVYGLSEYNRATGDTEALEYAVKLFDDIESHSFDREKNGYLEAFTREWGSISDMRLSEKDINECKTMNTHLHIIEPYTALYRVWRNPLLCSRLHNLAGIFSDLILDSGTGHLKLFFNEDWISSHRIVSYGHDIEASWLLWETAGVLGDRELEERLRPVCIRVAEAAAEGYLPGGGMLYELHGNGAVDADRHWWVQAETVAGYFNIWQMTGDIASLDKALDCWQFIKKHIIDRQHGEWLWSLKADGTGNTRDDKAGFWKCPYHNSRMCLEIIERTLDL